MVTILGFTNVYHVKIEVSLKPTNFIWISHHKLSGNVGLVICSIPLDSTKINVFFLNRQMVSWLVVEPTPLKNDGVRQLG
jgi:hypothetical protein